MDLPDPGIEPGSPALQVDSLPAELQGKPQILTWSHVFHISLSHLPPQRHLRGYSFWRLSNERPLQSASKARKFSAGKFWENSFAAAETLRPQGLLCSLGSQGTDLTCQPALAHWSRHILLCRSQRPQACL